MEHTPSLVYSQAPFPTMASLAWQHPVFLGAGGASLQPTQSGRQHIGYGPDSWAIA